MRHVITALIVILATPAWAQDFAARVVGITDGDTLTVLTPEKKQVQIRLHGVDAPELRKDFGTKAKERASELAFGQAVTIRERDRDRYGRTVAEVILPDGESLNRELTREGYTWWYRTYAPHDRELAALEAEARDARRGLWSQPNPVPPWEWRRDGGVAVPMEAGAVGNRNSHIYRTPNCRSLGKMKAENRVLFKDAAEAEKAGFRRAGDCR